MGYRYVTCISPKSIETLGRRRSSKLHKGDRICVDNDRYHVQRGTLLE
jgi:hypothetical protein